ncbi:MAG: hypothetical protein LBU05_03975 [Bifidobacteriaceae bacterium]|jgi:hypothetical protein|nr:hypothetical protein [Bifidobacteriaceae bacterium]
MVEPSNTLAGLRPALPTRPPEPDDRRFPAAERSFAIEIADQRADDPLIGVKVGSGLFLSQLVQALANVPN